MKKHKHLFKKISDQIVQVEFKKQIKQIFNIDLPIPKDKKVANVKQWIVKYQCECGAVQSFADEPDGVMNHNLPKEFTIGG